MDSLYIIFYSSPMLFIACVGILGLLVGSFLNVVIARLPITLKQNWVRDCYEYLELTIPASEQEKLAKKINLLLPRSHCPKCKNVLRIIDNIPVLSYIFLRGKCHFCNKHISLKYPLVELISATACMLVAWRFGVAWQTLAGCMLSWVLIVQAGIDLEHKLIPDEVTLPMIWLGLICSIFAMFCNQQASIVGAVSGYLVLWFIYWAFYLATKKEGIGYGDFKLLAMLGAWLGWQALPFIVIFSSVLGSTIGLVLLSFTKISRNTRIPFGPFLAIAGWIALLWGSDINEWYLSYVGIF